VSPASAPGGLRQLANIGSSSSVAAGLPASAVDETKVPHYFGPNPNWANSPFTVPDAVVTISAPTEAGGVQAEAVASVGLGGAVTGITVTNPGSGYTGATVTIEGSGTGAAADAVLTATGIVTNIAITASGTGYTAPSITISGGGATTQARATVYGGVEAVTLDPGADYSGFTFPTVDFDFPNDPNGTMPKAHPTCADPYPNCQSDVPGTTYTVTGIVVDDPGSGYSVAPGVVIRDGTQANPINNRAQDRAKVARIESARAEREGTQAAVAAFAGPIVFAAMTPASTTLVMQYVTVETFGAGYTSAPSATINDPTGTGATAQTFIDTGGVTGITVTAPGSGYMTKDGIKKFTDPLPGLCIPPACPAYDPALPTEQQPKFIPAGAPEVKTYNGVEADESWSG